MPGNDQARPDLFRQPLAPRGKVLRTSKRTRIHASERSRHARGHITRVDSDADLDRSPRAPDSNSIRESLRRAGGSLPSRRCRRVQRKQRQDLVAHVLVDKTTVVPDAQLHDPKERVQELEAFLAGDPLGEGREAANLG